MKRSHDGRAGWTRFVVDRDFGRAGVRRHIVRALLITAVGVGLIVAGIVLSNPLIVVLGIVDLLLALANFVLLRKIVQRRRPD